MEKVQWIPRTLTTEQHAIYEELRTMPHFEKVSNASLRFLVQRGYCDSTSIMNLFSSGFQHLHDYRLLLDGPLSLQLIQDAIRRQLNIVIYGDYDVDGIGATSALVLGLRYLGARVTHFTNHRFHEGYGLNIKGMNRLLSLYPTVDMIITVDNGISAFEGIAYAKEKGLTVIVTDHHEPPGNHLLPNADAIVNAKREGDTYPFRELCGAGLAFKLLIALAQEMKAPLDYIHDLVDIVGLSTIGDVVPLVDENRIIVRECLARIQEERRPFFRYLREQTGRTAITEEDLGYTYAPIMNAIGRLDGDVSSVIEALISHDLPRVESMVGYLIEQNERRKDLSNEQEQLAINLAESQPEAPILILKHPDFHEGVVGLVAGRLKERYYRPVILLSELTEEDPKTGELFTIIKGSARSIEGFHMKQALDALSDNLKSHGGHAAAAGLTVKEECYESFVTSLQQLAAQTLTPDLLIPKTYVDLWLTRSEVNAELKEELDWLRPFGTSFEKPRIVISDFTVEKVSYIGKESRHLRLVDSGLTAILFNKASDFIALKEPQHLQLMGYPEWNNWQGRISLQFKASDFQF